MPHKNPEDRRAYINARAKAMREGTWESSQVVSEPIPCDHCGTMFRRPPANRTGRNRRGTKNYCSRDCMALAYQGRMVGEKSPRWKGRETRPCDHCGSPVTRPAWAWKNRSLTFCDRSCFAQWKSANWTAGANPSWRGGHAPYYGGNWKRQQREARRRDGHQCKFCGISESQLRRALDVHHICPFRYFRVENCRVANRLSNLVSLCEHCHTYLERFSRDGSITDWDSLRAIGMKARSDATVTTPQTGQTTCSDSAE